MLKSIAVTVGEPAGIGPEIVVRCAAHHPELFKHCLVIGNQKLLETQARQLKLPCGFDVLDIPLAAPVIPGKLDVRNAAFVIEMLTQATQLALSKKISAIVTGPIHKGILNQAGFDIKGHTDFLSRQTHCETVMMLMNQQLKIALLSDHIPLREVPGYLTTERLTRCLEIIIRDFKKKFGIKTPRIVVCGLNPHAGEQGYLGDEEKNIMTPVIKKFHQMGPVGADIAFTQPYREQSDVILALYHDQGLPVIKYAGFHETINVTLGLPFVRTSVDHGTALDIAGTGHANINSLLLATKSALTQTQHERS